MKRSDQDVIMKYTTCLMKALKFKIVPKIKFGILETLKMSMSASSSIIYQNLGERALVTWALPHWWGVWQGGTLAIKEPETTGSRVRTTRCQEKAESGDWHLSVGMLTVSNDLLISNNLVKQNCKSNKNALVRYLGVENFVFKDQSETELKSISDSLHGPCWL